eukprot:scaffold84805_cov22-Tisochrysis_lutea.AAC.1
MSSAFLPAYKRLKTSDPEMPPPQATGSISANAARACAHQVFSAIAIRSTSAAKFLPTQTMGPVSANAASAHASGIQCHCHEEHKCVQCHCVSGIRCHH